MNKEDFQILTKGTITEIISWAEIYLRATLPKENVKLVSYETTLAEGIDEVVEYLVNAVYKNTDDIKPCIDLSVVDYDDTTVSIMYMPTGHEGRPYGLNWAGKPGPYIKCIDGKLLKARYNKEFPPEWNTFT